jgi:hypothetical protein
MNDTPDLEQTAIADNGGALDTREAARLLEQTSREARRQFSMNPPLATALMGVLILLAYGALWVSVLGQHPYTGPNLGVIALVYATAAVATGVSVTLRQRATAGVSGPSSRQRAVEGIVILVSYLGSVLIQTALKYDGASVAIVYGVIHAAAAPLIIVGTGHSQYLLDDLENLNCVVFSTQSPVITHGDEAAGIPAAENEASGIVGGDNRVA